jgi:hypothetical protein
VIKEISIVAFVFIGIFSIEFVNILFNQNAYAHCFTPDDTATFITLVDQTKIELMLANNNFPSNVTIALDHAEDAATLMNSVYNFDDDITDDTDFIRKYSEDMSSLNSTVYAMVLANIVDEILRKYGKAYDLDYDLTNTSNMIMISDTNSSSFMNMHGSQHSNMTEKNNSSPLVNIADYQSAKQLSERAYEIFTNKLKPLSVSNSTNDDTVTAKLEKSLVDIKDLMMNNNETASQLMTIVHGQFHPILQTAYNLQLKQ